MFTSVSIGLTSAIAGINFWVGIYIYLGWIEIPQKEAQVIERFGGYCRVLQKGINILCLPGIVDEVVYVVNLKRQRVDLFQDEGASAMDFSDGTAPVKAQVWFTVRDKEVTKFVYAITDPISWIQERVDDYVRPLMQGFSVDDAQLVKAKVSNGFREVPDNAIPDKKGKEPKSLHDEVEDTIGIDWHSLLITDIDLPPEVRKARQRRIDGKTAAEERNRIATGYIEAINMMVEESRPKDAEGNPTGEPTQTFEQCKEIFDRNEGLRTLREADGVTFVGSNLSNIMVGVSDKS
jgi:regulator of protease activity HflC (stomatin/prohibitin superfamily)